MSDAGAEALPMIYVVDDDEPVRDAISLLLDTADIPHRSFDSAVAFLDACSAEWRGALLLDVRMPGMDGLELQRVLADRGFDLPIVFITGHGDVPMAVEAMKRGAQDFLRKPFDDDELLDSVRRALSAEARHSAEAEQTAALQSRVAELTPREQEVFERVAQGQANKVIAIELGISERTVEIHRSQVMHKTGCRSLAELVRLKIALDGNDVEP